MVSCEGKVICLLNDLSYRSFLMLQLFFTVCVGVYTPVIVVYFLACNHETLCGGRGREKLLLRMGRAEVYLVVQIGVH